MPSIIIIISISRIDGHSHHCLYVGISESLQQDTTDWGDSKSCCGHCSRVAVAGIAVPRLPQQLR